MLPALADEAPVVEDARAATKALVSHDGRI